MKKAKEVMKVKCKSNKNNKSENKEFKYIDDLNDEDFNNVYENYVVIEPGKIDIYKILQKNRKR